jgi:ABC-2 type transport system ATP-binding protein
MQTLVEARNLRKTYRGRVVVDGVDLLLERGETVAIIGPNGAGKSTTLDIILGLKKADGGTVRFWRPDPLGRIGVQLQQTPFFPGLGALENLKLFASFYRVKLTEARARELLELCGLADATGTEASRLSGGQQKRLAIAASLVHDPELVFLDEPTAALDPKARKEVHALIGKLAKSGTTVVFTSHDMEEVHRLAARVVMIRQGRIAAEGAPEELCARFGVADLADLYVKLVEEADEGDEGDEGVRT